VGALLAFGVGVGPRGLWWGFVIGLAAAAVLLTARFDRLTRRLIADPSLVPAVDGSGEELPAFPDLRGAA
jgi:MATE family multidrug resistance protein